MRVNTWLAVLLALFAVPPLYSPIGVSLALGSVGAVVLALGVHRHDRSGIDLGVAIQFVGVLVGGFGAVSPGLRLLSTLFSVLAWDVARYGLLTDEQLGPNANTARIELTHAGTSVAVAGAGSGLCYGIFLVSNGVRSATALGFLLLGAFALTAALR